MTARVLLFCGLAVPFAALSSANATPSAQGGFLARGFENASSTVFSSLRLLEYGGRERLDRIEAELFASFQSVPKNEFGRIEARSARYVMQMYFLREHGWQLTGLEPHGFMEEASRLEDMALLQEQAPALALVMAEAGGSSTGLALRDLALLVVTLERLVFDQYIDLLQTAYHANGFSPSQTLKQKDVDDVLCTFILLFETPEPERGNNPFVKMKFADLLKVPSGSIDYILWFVHDALRNDRFALSSSMSPFRETSFSFEDAMRVADNLVGSHGSSIIDEECTAGWDVLQPLSVHGLFSLDDFFASELEKLGWMFTETLDYLEEVGALDPATKRVRLANYILGPYNCARSSPYLSLCCKSKCDPITHEIMHGIQGPEAHPEQVAAVVANISSRYVEAPRQLPKLLLSRLQEIAERHDGFVRLHSRLFAQWLHNAFPSECPFPHIAGHKKVLQTAHWDRTLRESTQTVQQRRKHVVTVAEQARKQPHLPGTSDLHSWTDKEVFYLGLGQPAARFGFLAWSLPSLYWLAALALLLAVGRHLSLLLAVGRQWLMLFHSAGATGAGDKAKKVQCRLASRSPLEPTTIARWV